MVILITGASHTGKTVLAQKLLEKYKFPYLSIDHLKMGLIRSGYTSLTPVSDDDKLTAYLWPIVMEIIKTAVENEQNLIVEGCYIPFCWKDDFEDCYLKYIRYICLIMSERYIREHYTEITGYAATIEKRGDDLDYTKENLIIDNNEALKNCQKYGLEYYLIDNQYSVNIEL